jgi:PDZ domain-containing protein
MFTLELYSLLSQKDIRHGLEIAGTGTMNSDGEVGRIGGIDKKVIAAEYAGADVFFAPDDPISDELKEKYPDIKTNYEEAVAAIKANKLNIEVVPIKTVNDAVKYLENKK